MDNKSLNKTEDYGQLLKTLVDAHYNVLLALCDDATEQVIALKKLEGHKNTSQYILLCNSLISDIQSVVKDRIENLVPYLRTLFEKEEDNHDCRNCTGTGKCGMQHALHLAGLRESHKKDKNIIYRLQMAALPLYSDTGNSDVYNILRNHIALLESALSELFHIEAVKLIPKVIEAQNKINAGD